MVGDLFINLFFFCATFQEPKFVSGGDKAQKLVDLSNFSIYFDTELLGDLEGQALVVSTVPNQEYSTLWSM